MAIPEKSAPIPIGVVILVSDMLFEHAWKVNQISVCISMMLWVLLLLHHFMTCGLTTKYLKLETAKNTVMNIQAVWFQIVQIHDSH